MPVTRADVRRWIEAGLVDATTAERILAYEGELSAEREARLGRPGIPELLVYLASAIVAAGVTVLVATNWEHLGSAARIAIPGLAAAVVLIVGYMLRATKNDALIRGASLSWLLGGVLLCGTAAIAAREAGWSEENVALAAGAVAIAASIALWNIMRMHPQVVGMGAAAFLFSTAVSTRAGEDWIIAVLGFVLALFGLAGLLATEAGVLVPRSSARLVAAAGLAFGAFWAGMPPSPPITELLSLAVFGVLIAAGVRRQSLVYVGFGVVTGFQALLKLVLRHVDDPTLAGLALIGLGLLLLLAIAGLRSSKLWGRWSTTDRDGGMWSTTPTNEQDVTLTT